MGYEAINYDIDSDHVATITLSRPDKLNAFNRVMLYEFSQVWSEVRQRVLRLFGPEPSEAE